MYNTCLFKNKALCCYRDWDSLSPLGKNPQIGLSHLSMAWVFPQKILVILRENRKSFGKDLNLAKIPTEVNRCFLPRWEFMYCLKCLKPAVYCSAFSTKTTVHYKVIHPTGLSRSWPVMEGQNIVRKFNFVKTFIYVVLEYLNYPTRFQKRMLCVDTVKTTVIYIYLFS